MNERDRQKPYERSHQQGGGYRGSESYDSPRQANQWQSDEYRQQGGNWQQDSGRQGHDDDAAREYRFSGQSNASYDAGYQSRDDDQRGSNRSYESSRGGYGEYRGQGYGQQGQSRDRDWQDRGHSEGNRYDRGQGGSRGRYGQQSYGQQRSTPYAGRNYDASGGNDFGSFTSEDFGGRDFYNRGGGISGGMRSSESYKPTYSAARLFDRDDDDRRGDDHRSGRDYNDWQSYGESRGFLQRAGDEVASWFGDEEASRRREQDRRDDYRGRGPSGYTRSDERIREDANDHLTHDWGVDASNITVSVKDGEITLDGTVDSRQAKRRAEDCVEHISGVKHVQNNLRVQERSQGSFGGSSSSYGSTQNSTSQGAVATGQNGTASGTSTSGTTGSGASGTSGSTSTGTGANTTSGIGSTATGGIGNASATLSSDKTS
jgi:osmotically-inducible protein OsmY